MEKKKSVCLCVGGERGERGGGMIYSSVTLTPDAEIQLN